MTPDAILISVALLLVAVGLAAVAFAIARRGTPDAGPRSVETAEPSSVSIAPPGLPGHEADDNLDDESGAPVLLEAARVIKTTSLPDGQVEVLIEWDPTQMPSAFRAKTVEEATKNGMDAIRVKRAAQGDY